MTHSISIVVSTVLTALLASASHGQALFAGPAGGTGEIRVYAPDGTFAVPLGLEAVRFLPVELSGRSTFEVLLPSAPRLRGDIPGASRLELPQHAGSIYRFERPNGTAATFGWIHVSNGDARILLEQPGTGPLESDDPFLPEAAFASGALLVASRTAAGGKLFELDLTAGTATERSASGTPIDVVANGLRLFENWGVAAGATGFWRFDRTPGASASLAGGPVAPAALFGGIGAADSGVLVASAGVDGGGNQRIFVVGPSSPVQACAVAGAALLGASAPGASTGPFIALSDDGSLCAWTTDEGVSREVWTQPVDPVAAPLSSQMTQDMNFVDTLDETGFLRFAGQNKLLLAVGEPDIEGIDSADVYAIVDSASPSPEITNLSATSQETATPFGGDSELSSEAGLYLAPDRSAIVAVARESGSGRLLWIPLDGTPPLELLPDGKEILMIEALDDAVLTAVLRSGAGPDRVSLLSIPLANPGQFTELANVPEFVIFDRPALLQSNSLGLVAAAGGAQFLARINASGITLVSSFAATFGPTVTASGETLTATFAPSPTVAFPFHWSPTTVDAAAPQPGRGIRSSLIADAELWPGGLASTRPSVLDA